MVPLGIDREKLLLQLERLEEHLSSLMDLRAKDIQKNEVNIAAAERLLQLSIQDCLNIGNHLITGLALKRADTYREIFSRLEENGIIPDELAKVMMEFTSFRNRLVHLYWEVKKEEVISKINEGNHLKRYAEQINEYLKKQNLL